MHCSTKERHRPTAVSASECVSRVFGIISIAKQWCCGLIFGNVALDQWPGLKNSEPRCFACYAELRLGPKASAPTGHCCHHLRACGFPAGIADWLARKSSRELAARAKHMFSGLFSVFSGPCLRPRDEIAKHSQITLIPNFSGWRPTAPEVVALDFGLII